jgi:hypothetical protein
MSYHMEITFPVAQLLTACNLLMQDCTCILVLNEPKTYATLVKSGGTGVGIGSLSSTVSTSPNAPAKPTTSPVSHIIYLVYI